MNIDMDITPREGELVSRIVTRFAALFAARTNRAFTQHASLSSHLVACHKNACRLDLEELYLAGDADFINDVGGISRAIDMTNGTLNVFYKPRYAFVPSPPQQEAA